MRLLALPLLCFSALIAEPVAAQTPAMPTMELTSPHNDPSAIPLATGGVPGGAASETWFKFAGQRTVRNVTRATLTPVLPARGKATGAAVVVVPGGGFMMLSMDNEGWPVARWLADHGIAAFVLKYRLNPTPQDQAAFSAALKALFARPSFQPGDSGIATPEYAVQDGLAAIELVRSRAREWGVDSHRVGMMGFSAGAMTTLQVVLRSTRETMPAFVAMNYGPMTRVAVPAAAPPLFASMALDDPLFGKMGFGLVESWHAAGKAMEFHAYQAGGHGYGLGLVGSTSDGWIDAFHKWMETNGFLKGRPGQ